MATFATLNKALNQHVFVMITRQGTEKFTKNWVNIRCERRTRDHLLILSSIWSNQSICQSNIESFNLSKH